MTRYIGTLASVNNRVIVEAYKKEGLKSTVNNGFALIAQKNNLKGLKVLADATLADGTAISKGQTVYLKEELLHTSPWASKPLESEAIYVHNEDGTKSNVPFMIVDGTYIEMVGN